VLFVLATSVALAALLAKDTSGETSLAPALGLIGIIPCIAGLAAVITLWRGVARRNDRLFPSARRPVKLTLDPMVRRAIPGTSPRAPGHRPVPTAARSRDRGGFVLRCCTLAGGESEDDELD
jgi:hypothetical protein